MRVYTVSDRYSSRDTEITQILMKAYSAAAHDLQISGASDKHLKLAKTAEI